MVPEGLILKSMLTSIDVGDEHLMIHDACKEKRKEYHFKRFIKDTMRRWLVVMKLHYPYVAIEIDYNDSEEGFDFLRKTYEASTSPRCSLEFLVWIPYLFWFTSRF